MTAVLVQDDLREAKQCIAKVFAEQTLAKIKTVSVQHDLRKAKQCIAELIAGQPPIHVCLVWILQNSCFEVIQIINTRKTKNQSR